MILVRVYGLLINEQKEILISHEQYGKHRMTKFPGGGLEYGEGTIECLTREFKEKLGMDVEILEHYYTTDFFQKSAYHEKAQVLSIYYLVRTTDAPPTSHIKDEHVLSVEFISIQKTSENTLTLPIDQLVMKRLKKSIL